MPLPNTFANQTAPNMVELDQNFTALGALTPIPCSFAGTNTISLAPLGDTPAITSYENYQPFTGIANGTNTGPVLVAVVGLPVLSVFKDAATGPAQLTGQEMVAGNAIVLTYDSALNGGSGGFHLGAVPQLSNPRASEINTVTSATGTTLTAAVLTSSGQGFTVILRQGSAGGAFNDTTDTAAAIVSAIIQPQVGSLFQFRMINTTGQTQTLVGGANVTVNSINNTTANGATHDFVGVVTAISVPAVVIYG